MKENRIKRALFGGCFIALLLPFVQLCFSPFTGLGLWGDYTIAPNIAFTWDAWWNGSYQQAKNLYLNDQGGFRPDLVRINNEADYRLFDKLHSNSVVMGKNNCLYQREYITAYYGKDYVGYDKVQAQLAKVKAIQDTLARLGKSLVVVHTPCKAFFYPEHFPDDMEEVKIKPSNYEVYARVADSLKINQVDFNAWFVKLRPHAKSLLYPRLGIHWSVYGSLLAADSLTTYIEQLRHIAMPHMLITGDHFTTKPHEPDDDIARALNLIVPITKEVYNYPDQRCTEDTTKTKPKVIYIGDSFILNLLRNSEIPCTNRDWEVWYYNRLVLNETNHMNSDAWLHMETYPWQQQLLKADCIVLMYTSHNMHEFGNGFVEKAFNYFYPAKR